MRAVFNYCVIEILLFAQFDLFFRHYTMFTVFHYFYYKTNGNITKSHSGVLPHFAAFKTGEYILT